MKKSTDNHKKHDIAFYQVFLNKIYSERNENRTFDNIYGDSTAVTQAKQKR